MSAPVKKPSQNDRKITKTIISRAPFLLGLVEKPLRRLNYPLLKIVVKCRLFALPHFADKGEKAKKPRKERQNANNQKINIHLSPLSACRLSLFQELPKDILGEELS